MKLKCLNISDIAGKISINRIKRSNMPFFFGWVGILIWLDFCVMPMGKFPVTTQLFGYSIEKLFSIIYLIATVAVICFFKGGDYIKLLPVSGAICIAGIAFSILYSKSEFVLYIMLLCAIATGHLFASFGYAFFMLLNNSEKFYAMLLGVFISKLLTFLRSVIPTPYDLIVTVLPLILITVCCFFTRGRFTDVILDMNKRLPVTAYSVMILVFVSYVLNDVIAPTMLQSIISDTLIHVTAVYFVGILIGVFLTYLIRKIIQINICYSVNISFMCLGLGAFFAVLTEKGATYVYLTALLFGIAYAMGFITIYYMCGIMAKRFQSVRFYRIGVTVSGAAYIFGFAVTNCFPLEVDNVSFIIVAAASIILSMLIFMFSPLFIKTIYSAEWTDDLYRPDVTYGSRLDERFKELSLSPREAELCKLLLDGYTLRQIATTLGIAYSTANTYQTGLYRKLNINSKIELLLMFKEYIKNS